ncbi:MAG: hypothetical protein RLY31_369 [Bacteroidota bacterium]
MTVFADRFAVRAVKTRKYGAGAEEMIWFFLNGLIPSTLAVIFNMMTGVFPRRKRCQRGGGDFWLCSEEMEGAGQTEEEALQKKSCPDESSGAVAGYLRYAAGRQVGMIGTAYSGHKGFSAVFGGKHGKGWSDVGRTRVTRQPVQLPPRQPPRLRGRSGLGRGPGRPA